MAKTSMTGPVDMSRRPDLAGQTVMQGDYEVSYDKNGYAGNAVNTKHELFQKDDYDGTYEQGTNWGQHYLNRDDDDGGSSGGGSSSSGSSSGSSGSTYVPTYSNPNYYESLQPTDLTEYLNQMYSAYNEAQLAALKSTYEQNLADLQDAADRLPQVYQTARNEAASQNDIARLAFQEYANSRGLNTGTSGQAALANSAVLQSNLAGIATQESDALADNALEQNRLAIQYRNAAVQAQADGNYQLAQALYNEYVRQDNAAMQTAQLAQQQANWEAQFNMGNYQWQQEFDTSRDQWQQSFDANLNQWQQQFDQSRDQWEQEFGLSQQKYQDTIAAQQKENAYNLAMTMLAAGVMPDTNTLNSAGISAADAMNIRLQALNGDTGGGRGSSGNSSSGKNNTSETSSGEGNSTVEMNQSNFNAFARSLASQLAGSNQNTVQGQNNLNAALGNIDSTWDQLSASQRQQILNLLSRYGIEYTP